MFFNEENLKRDCIYMKFFIEIIDNKMSNGQAKYILYSFFKKYALLIVNEYQKQKRLKIDMIDIKKLIDEESFEKGNYYYENIFDYNKLNEKRSIVLKDTVKIDSSDEYIKCLNCDKSTYFLDNNVDFDNMSLSDEDKKINTFICRLVNTNILYTKDLSEAISNLENEFSGNKIYGIKLKELQKKFQIKEIRVLCTLANEINIIARLMEIFKPLGIRGTEEKLLEDYLYLIQADIIENAYSIMKNTKRIKMLYEKEVENKFETPEQEKQFFENNREYRRQLHYNVETYVFDDKQRFINKQIDIIECLDKLLSCFFEKENRR